MLFVWPEISRPLYVCGTVLLIQGGFTAPAGAQESAIIQQLAEGQLRPTSKIVPPDPVRAEALPPDWGESDAGFVSQITNAQARAITDRAFPLMISKWPFNSVAVCWENPSDADATERSWVREAVEKSWQAHSGLHFTGWQPCQQNNKGIRIQIQDVGPYAVNLGKFINGVPNGMVLNFAFHNWGSACRETEARREACIKSIGVHEFGHALGFAHEQNRPDTPGECDQPAQGPNGDKLLTPWDKDSVMNYCNAKYNNEGLLSKFDIVAVEYIYGMPAP
jgi:hypothetical protein